ncbi:MAG: choice-of-anchor D domain-containing protein, partial [Planctomycetes bacterium]|nr:choice-of-anchor D domain-containing protein [Planctomycetota bacterium]
MKNSAFTYSILSLLFILTPACNVMINPTPEMLVKCGATEIPSETGIFDFGRVEVNETLTVIFTVQNNGNTNLKLTGEPMITILGSDADDFMVSAHPSTPISPGNYTTFRIKFMPTVSKYYSATVSIANNDDDKNPYTFSLTGRGIIIDINVRQDTQNIPSYTGVFDFGSIYLGNPSLTLIFTIENIGSKILQLTGAPKLIKISGSHASLFTIDQTLTTTPLSPGSSTTFSITFAPTTVGIKTAKISILNDDPDENPYEFTIRGECIDPEILVLDSKDNDIENNTGEFRFPDNFQNNAMSETYSIKNLGTTNLRLTGIPIIRITGTTSHVFTVGKKPANSIAPASETTFVIQFKPTNEMEYSATVTFANNDEDENPFTFTIFGVGYIPTFDFNGDGYDYVIIGAHQDYENGRYSGRAYLFYGRENCPVNIDCAEADVIFTSNLREYFGVSVAPAGDVNNDGFDDVIIGSTNSTLSGDAYIFFGRATPPS